MRLLFKQRLFSWLDSYDIYDENQQVLYTVEGKLSWGHCLHIHNDHDEHIGTIKEEVLTFLPKFNMYVQDQYMIYPGEPASSEPEYSGTREWVFRIPGRRNAPDR